MGHLCRLVNCTPLSGHQGKLKEEVQRKILTTFAYGTQFALDFRHGIFDDVCLNLPKIVWTIGSTICFQMQAVTLRSSGKVR